MVADRTALPTALGAKAKDRFGEISVRLADKEIRVPGTSDRARASTRRRRIWRTWPGGAQARKHRRRRVPPSAPRAHIDPGLCVLHRSSHPSSRRSRSARPRPAAIVQDDHAGLREVRCLHSRRKADRDLQRQSHVSAGQD
jgi:hypothetical protein